MTALAAVEGGRDIVLAPPARPSSKHVEIVIGRPWLQMMIVAAATISDVPKVHWPALLNVGVKTEAVAALAGRVAGASCPWNQTEIPPFSYRKKFMGAFDEIVARVFDVNQPTLLVVV